MADGGAKPRDEDEHPGGGQDPPAPQPPAPSPGPDRTLLLAEDIPARKRPRATPSHPRCPREVWGPRAGRVTGLYARLLRELEAEVRELQRALAARDEAVLHRDRRIRELELENRRLRSHVRSLEEENDLLSSRDSCRGHAATATRTLLASDTSCIGVSDSNIQFLKGLVELLEGDAAAQENGRPKVELVPNSGVYITHPQLDDLSQVSTDKPKLMTRRLLDYFFSRETLARSSATGQRIAHNNTTMEWPLRLPVAVVSAIKEYVTKMCGRGCNFNAVINSKCGTSRRAVKKTVVKMDQQLTLLLLPPAQPWSQQCPAWHCVSGEKGPSVAHAALDLPLLTPFI
ncbi:uncharacterized protein O3Q21_010838 [Podargus strigoides]